MNIINASAEIAQPIDGVQMLRHIEKCGRVCYKSEHRITDDSYIKFVSGIIKSGHESVLEHAGFTAHFVCDRGVSHEIVRHRLASYSQESTRYCNYSGETFRSQINVVRPVFFAEGTAAYEAWYASCAKAEREYFSLLGIGCTPQQARDVLPNSLATELYMTANLREWRHFFKLRCAPAAHPQMREVACILLRECKAKIPMIFDDIEGEGI